MLIRHKNAISENVFDLISKMRKSQKDPESYREAPENELQKSFVKNWSDSLPNYVGVTGFEPATPTTPK